LPFIPDKHFTSITFSHFHHCLRSKIRPASSSGTYMPFLYEILLPVPIFLVTRIENTYSSDIPSMEAHLSKPKREENKVKYIRVLETISFLFSKEYLCRGFIS
jgi:hypothetical protein